MENELLFTDRKAFRDWLTENHNTNNGIWLILGKAGYEPAFSNFQKMPHSMRITYTAHYLSAKQEETKKRRLEQIISRLNENKRPM